MNTTSTRIASTILLLPILATLLPLAAANGYEFKPPHDFIAIQADGFIGLEQISPEVSINDNGIVGFIGMVREAGSQDLVQSPFVIDTVHLNASRLIANPTRAFASEFGPGVQVNNLNELLTRRVAFERVGTISIPFAYLERWALAWDTRISLVSSYPLTPFLAPPQFEGILGHATHNNNGSFQFVAFFDTQYSITAVTSTEGTRTLELSDPSIRPRLADNNRFVFAFGNGVKVLQAPNNSPIVTLGTTTDGFSSIGSRPTISDDGNLVAFSGVLGTPRGMAESLSPGAGIFVYDVPARKLIRIAGQSANGHLDPGEFFQDSTRNGKLDSHSEVDLGLITEFDMNSPVCVNNNGLLVFCGKNTQGNRTVFASYVNRGNSLHPAANPYAVISVGDSISSLSGALSDLQIYDSAGGRIPSGEIALWAKTTSGKDAVIVATRRIQPVIFVPGMAGSDLYDNETKRWITISQENLLALSLAPGNEHSLIPRDASRYFDPLVLGTLGTHLYDNILETLALREGLMEFVPDVACSGVAKCSYPIPSEVVSQGFSLYVFPYDWRLDNAVNANHLRLYLERLHELYPDSKMSIISHSNGGLVVRNALLQGDLSKYVDKVVTLNSPILGTPQAYYRMLTGVFYDIPVVDLFTGDDMREIVAHFEGVHQLIPGAAYWEKSSKSPMSHRRADVSDTYEPIEMTFHEVAEFMNAVFGTTPVANSAKFHTIGQDNWGSDKSTVAYAHIVTVQAELRTPDQVVIWDERLDDDLHLTRRFRRHYGFGDGTVAVLSSIRDSSMWAPQSRMSVLVAGAGEGSDYSDAFAEHNGGLHNARLHRNLLYFLRTGNILDDDPDPVSSPPRLRPASSLASGTVRELEIVGFSFANIENPKGVSNVRNGDMIINSMLDDVTYSRSGDHAVTVLYPSDGRYLFTMEKLEVRPKYAALDVRSLSGGTLVAVTRYLDLVVPLGGRLQLEDNGANEVVLRMDADGDGIFETVVPPYGSAIGPAAQDEVPPRIKVIRSCLNNGEPILELSASDEASEVRELALWRSQNSKREGYISPLRPDSFPDGSLFAEATDSLGNRTPPVKFDVLPKLNIDKDGVNVVLRWEKSCWPLIVEQSNSLAPGAEWRKVTVPPTDTESEKVVVVSPGSTTQFFRLRLASP